MKRGQCFVSNDKTGMTLMELAIVFGVIGLVLGGIWTATAAVYSNYRLSLVTRRLMDIVHNIHSLYGMGTNRTMEMAIQDVAGASTLAMAGVFPSDMLDGDPPHVVNSWGGDMTVDALHINVDGDGVRIGFKKVPNAICANLIVRMTGAQKDPSLLSVGTETQVFTSDLMPIKISDAVLACPLTMNKVMFSFSLKT